VLKNIYTLRISSESDKSEDTIHASQIEDEEEGRKEEEYVLDCDFFFGLSVVALFISCIGSLTLAR
jgi:hypothetical protein